MEKIVIYTDGASRGNPGESSYGLVVFDNLGNETYREGKYIGYATNNIAEYTAVIKALSYLKGKFNGVDIEIRADSNLVVQQLSGKFKIKAKHIGDLINKVRQLEKSFNSVIYSYIPRAENKQADRLANLALNLHQPNR